MLPRLRKVGVLCMCLIVVCCSWRWRLADVDVAPLSKPRSSGTRICENDDRLRKIREYCAANEDLERRNKRAVAGLMVSDKHKVLICLHAKVGCTTWATIMAQNNLPENSQESVIRTPFSDLARYNLRFLDESYYSEADIQYRINNYYKIMVVRHPYDRLQSFFHGKFGTGRYNDTVGRQVMDAYHPDLNHTQRAAGTVSFSDIIRWIEDGHKDQHWDGPYHKKCLPCSVQYDYIVKLETFARDSEYIITQKLSGRGLNTNKNSRRGAFGSGRHLNLFHNLTSYQLQFLRYRLQHDLDMLSYSFDERTMMATCGDGEQCC